ncbi:hypothetical protein OE230_02745 [Levilactobacillus brevis]|nr:hypothetical protein OE230_02745 [Levilactobacillus brevis]
MNTDLGLIFKNLGIVGLDVIVIPFIFITVLTYLNRDTKRFLANGFGLNSELYLGFLGIFFHELSHLVTALVFGHRIDRVRLLKRLHPDQPGFDGQPDLALGYVNHSWNQRNCLFQGMLTLVANPFALDWVGFRQALGGDTHAGLRWTLMLVLSLNISVGGFDLSTADFANSRIGFIGFVTLVTILTVGLTMLNHVAAFLKIVTAAMILLAVVLSYALLVSLITNLLVRLALQIKDH